MKLLKIIPIMILLSMTALMSCTKDAGPVGKKSITGTVTYKDGSGNAQTASGAFVYIKYGTLESTTSYDDVTVADANGKYTLGGLAKGDYYVTASLTDEYGFEYSTYGFGVTINNQKDDLTLDMELQ